MEFYSRQIVLPQIGYNGQLKFRNSKVCIVGLGGLGSSSALQVAALGAGYLRIVDRDVVELSNLQRQHLYGVNWLGYPKVEVAAKRLRELNPYIKVEPLPVSINTLNVQDVVTGMDVVIDGLDSMKPRYALNRACQNQGIPYIFGAAIMTYGNVSTIIPGETPCLECFYGNLDDEVLPKCAVVGVHQPILKIIASVQVSEATRIILGKKPLLANILLHIDIANMAFEEVQISKTENCPVCSSTPYGSKMEIKHKFVSEVCGRGGRRTFFVTPEKNLEFNMDQLLSRLETLGFKVTVKTELGISFLDKAERRGSILKSGLMILEGLKNEREAYILYKKVVRERREPYDSAVN